MKRIIKWALRAIIVIPMIIGIPNGLRLLDAIPCRGNELDLSQTQLAFAIASLPLIIASAIGGALVLMVAIIEAFKWIFTD